MSDKNKKSTPNSQTLSDKLNSFAMQAGLVLMAGAATLLMVELPEHPNKVVVPNQPAFAMASDAGTAERHSVPERSHREETHPHQASYGTLQRTPGRTGSL